ncbi:MAG: 50S ribosomal protein L23, partial [Sphingopyxis sp.]|nr:50S ribosomal protein L23 [Sphingopyxis sp.]
MAKAKTIDARHYDVILAPARTEKRTRLSEINPDGFKVGGSPTKPATKT